MPATSQAIQKAVTPVTIGWTFDSAPLETHAIFEKPHAYQSAFGWQQTDTADLLHMNPALGGGCIATQAIVQGGSVKRDVCGKSRYIHLTTRCLIDQYKTLALLYLISPGSEKIKPIPNPATTDFLVPPILA